MAKRAKKAVQSETLEFEPNVTNVGGLLLPPVLHPYIAELPARDSGVDAVQARWRKDFLNMAKSIPGEWLFHDASDGFVGIHPEHRNTPVVNMYHELTLVGYARGWL